MGSILRVRQRRSPTLRFDRWFLNGLQPDWDHDSPIPLMRSRLIRKSLSGLPRTDQHLTPKSRSRFYRSGFSCGVKTFFAILFASLGLSLTFYAAFHRLWSSRRPTAANSVLSHFTSKPPLVDRTILEKIARLYPEGETDAESGTDFSIPINDGSSDVFSPFFRLPRVTLIPEAQPQAPLNLEMETQNQFCAGRNGDRGTPCRFLLPLRIGEQGSNAHVYLVQLLELARALNRTLVLPNVGKNRAGACRRWGFGIYYDEHALSSTFGGNHGGVIQQDRFRAWIDSLASPPSSQLVSLNWTYHKSFLPVAVSRQSSGGLDIHTHNPSDAATMFAGQTGCLNKKFPQLDLTGSFPPLSFVVADHSKQGGNNGDISRTLLKKLAGPTLTRSQPEPLTRVGGGLTNYDFDHAHISPDVLVVSWNVPVPIFQPHSNTSIYHSPQLRALAARMGRRLGPYIAVIWDVETSSSDVVLECVEALRSSLHYVLRGHEQSGIRNIWLTGKLSPSDLLHSPQPLCPSTVTKEAFFAPDVKLTGARQELERMVREGEEVDDVANNGNDSVRKQEVLKDVGVLGILDKLVSMRSTVFVVASRGCGKTRCVFPPPTLKCRRELMNRPHKSSPFTGEVLDWRKKNPSFFFDTKVGSRVNRVWGRTDRVVKEGGVVEFG